jgi:hypothetical protein
VASRPTEFSRWLRFRKIYRDETARENFLRPNFSQRYLAWLLDVLSHAYGGDHGHAHLDNFPITFAKLPEAKLERFDLIGASVDDSRDCGSLLLLVSLAWWGLDLQRRGENLASSMEGIQWQYTLIALTRAFRAVANWRAGQRHNNAMDLEPVTRVVTASKVRARLSCKTQTDAEHSEYEVEVDQLEDDSKDKLEGTSPALPAPPVRRPTHKAATKSSNRAVVAKPASMARHAPVARKPSTSGPAPPSPPAAAPPIPAQPLALVIPPAAILAPSAASPSVAALLTSTATPQATDHEPASPAPPVVSRKAPAADAAVCQAALEKQCGILRPSAWAIPWDPSTSTMSTFRNGGKPLRYKPGKYKVGQIPPSDYESSSDDVVETAPEGHTGASLITRPSPFTPSGLLEQQTGDGSVPVPSLKMDRSAHAMPVAQQQVSAFPPEGSASRGSITAYLDEVEAERAADEALEIPLETAPDTPS